ncbi:hypothetical protein [Pseudomonas sp. L-22-4S-12]|uniref:hypothetical protein n=1 Tax=Pseudomonas sp. L-22-4S-12 TaxID=2610893 RepID=UPI002113C610|nr:hypothetical protein [Pseudomonas sp. L-22-4S-12]
MSTENKTLQQLLNERVAAYVVSDRPKELIDAGLDAMFKEVVTDAFRGYGDFTKEFKEAFKAALPANVGDMLELAKYNTLVAEALKARWAETAVSEVMLAKANAAITEILEDAPLEGEVSLTKLLNAFVDEHKESAAEEHWEAPEIRFEEGDTSHGEYLHIYFDKEPEESRETRSSHGRGRRENYALANALHICIEEKRDSGRAHIGKVEVGRVYSAKLDETPINKELRYHSPFERLVAALYFGQARLVIDCDQDDFSYGIYG